MRRDWVGGEDLVQFLSVRAHLLFPCMQTCLGMKDFHTAVFEADYILKVIFFFFFFFFFLF